MYLLYIADIDRPRSTRINHHRIWGLEARECICLYSITKITIPITRLLPKDTEPQLIVSSLLVCFLFILRHEIEGRAWYPNGLDRQVWCREPASTSAQPGPSMTCTSLHCTIAIIILLVHLNDVGTAIHRNQHPSPEIAFPNHGSCEDCA